MPKAVWTVKIFNRIFYAFKYYLNLKLSDIIFDQLINTNKVIATFQAKNIFTLTSIINIL